MLLAKRQNLFPPFATTFDGDPAECSKHLGRARGILSLMCRSIPPVKSRTETTADGTDIQVTTNPNHVYIKAGNQAYITYTDWKSVLNDPLIIPAPPYTWNHRDRFVHKSHKLITVEPPPLVPPNRAMDLPRFDPVVKAGFYVGGGRNQSSQDGYWISKSGLAVSWQGRQIYIKGLRYEADFLTDSDISTNSKFIVACAVHKNNLLVVVWELNPPVSYITQSTCRLVLKTLSYEIIDTFFSATLISSRVFFEYENSLIDTGIAPITFPPYCCFLANPKTLVINTTRVSMRASDPVNDNRLGVSVSDKFLFEVVFNDDFSLQTESNISIPITVPYGTTSTAVVANSYKNNVFIWTWKVISYIEIPLEMVTSHLSYIYDAGAVTRYESDIAMDFSYTTTLQNYAFPFFCSKGVLIVAKWDISNSARGWIEIHKDGDAVVIVEGVFFPELVSTFGIMPAFLTAFDGVLLIIASKYYSYIINVKTGEMQTLDYDVSTSGVVGEYYQVSVTNI